MITLRSLARRTAAGAVAAGVVLGVAVPSATAAAPKRTVDPLVSVEVVSGHVASYAVSFIGFDGPTISWQYSADGGKTFKALAGKTGSTLSVTSVTARNLWKIRAKVTDATGSAYSHSAFLIVHSTVSDPFTVDPGLENAPALTSGWLLASYKSGLSSTAASALVMSEKLDPTARTSDLHAAFRDASGAYTAATVTKYHTYSSTDIALKLRATPPASQLKSTKGDVWKVRDIVTNESEYFAVS